MTHIVIPLHSGGGRYGSDLELRYTLRAWERHFQGDFDLTIAGSRLPAWMQGKVKLLRCGDLKDALRVTAKAYPDGFVWTYDDSLPIKDVNEETLKFVPANLSGGSANTPWTIKVEEVRKRLLDAGLPARDYSRPHGPYWFDASMVEEGFVDCVEDMRGKFPWETWILNKRRQPWRTGVVKNYYGKYSGPPGPRHHFVNYSDGGISDELLEWLEQCFPAKSQWEIDMPLPVRASSPEKSRASVSLPVSAEFVPAVSPNFLPVGKVTPPQRVEIHTLRYGSPVWMPLCTPSLEAWCSRNFLPLRVWGEADFRPEYPDQKFLEIDMLRAFLEGDNEWFMFVDADTLLHEQAPAPYFDKPGIHAKLDKSLNSGPRRSKWEAWCLNNFGAYPPRKYVYMNAGVWACDRQAAALFLKHVSSPYIKSVMEQDQWNWWWWKAQLDGVCYNEIDPRWHTWVGESGLAWLYHLLARSKYEAAKTLLRNGRLRNTGGEPVVQTLGEAALTWKDTKRAASPAKLVRSEHLVHEDLRILGFGNGRLGNQVLEALHATSVDYDRIRFGRWTHLLEGHPYEGKRIRTLPKGQHSWIRLPWHGWNYKSAGCDEEEVAEWLLGRNVEPLDKIAIHIRQGDKLWNDHYVKPGRDYYARALDLIRRKLGNLPVLMFAEDEDYAEGMLRLRGLERPASGSALDTWKTMARCRAIVTADSTFSASAAILAPYVETVVFPVGASTDRRLGLCKEDWTPLSPGTFFSLSLAR